MIKIRSLSAGSSRSTIIRVQLLVWSPAVCTANPLSWHCVQRSWCASLLPETTSQYVYLCLRSRQSSDSEVRTLSPRNFIKLSDRKNVKMTLKCQLSLFYRWNSRVLWNCRTGAALFQGKNVKECRNCTGRKCENEEEKWVTAVAGAKGEGYHCLSEIKRVSIAVNK